MNPSKIVHKLLFALNVVLAVFIISSASWAATYYLDATNGNDNNDGLSPSTAWRTIAKANASSFNPGDSVLFERGEIWREQLTVSSSGSSGNPITFGAYGTGAAPVIKGSVVMTGWEEVAEGVYKKGSVEIEPYVVVYNGRQLKPKNGARGNLGPDEFDWDSHVLYVNVGGDPDAGTLEASQRLTCIDIGGYVVVDRLELKFSNWANVIVGLNGVIRNCTINHPKRHGIYISANNVEIHNNTIVGTVSGVKYPESGIYVHGGENIDIHNNDISYSRIGIAICQYGSPITGGRIYENRIHHIDTEGERASNPDLQGIELVGQTGAEVRNIEVYRNLVHNCGGAGIATHEAPNSMIYYNVVHDCGLLKGAAGGDWEGAISIWADSDSCEVYNNTVYNSEMGFKSDSSSHGIQIKNNIFRNSNTYGIYAYGSNVKNDYNAVSASRFRDFYGVEQGPHSFTSDPEFTDVTNDDFTLQSTSPCIDSGVYVGLTKDYAGTPVPVGSGVDIGAFEYKEDRKPPAPPGGVIIQ